MRAGRDSFPFKQSAMSVQSKHGLIAGVCTLALKSQGIPAKCYSKGQKVEHVWILQKQKEPFLFYMYNFLNCYIWNCTYDTARDIVSQHT